MVPYDFAQRVLQPGGTTAPSPYFCRQPGPLWRTGHGQYESAARLWPTLTEIKAPYVSGTKSNGNMSYNSLQAVLQRDMVHGLQGQVSYTYSKCMSDSTGYYGAWNNALSASAYWQNIYNQRSEWAPCYYDATHVLSAYAIYQLPFGRGQKFGGDSRKAVDEVIGGWEIAPLVSVRTGWPMPVFGASDNSGTFGRGARANCNSLPSITNTPVADVGRQWFVNNGNFVQPAPGTFGDCAPQLSGLRSPRYTDLDFSVHKNFQITERFKLQFRTDFINSLNHPQFEAPNMSLGQTMGQITGAQPPRNIQVALKLYY